MAGMTGAAYIMQDQQYLCHKGTEPGKKVQRLKAHWKQQVVDTNLKPDNKEMVDKKETTWLKTVFDSFCQSFAYHMQMSYDSWLMVVSHFKDLCNVTQRLHTTG